MTEPRLLDEPLSDAELDELEAFLASDAVPQDCMDLEMLDGYLTAVVSGPEVIQPSEWLPQVWSDGGKSAAPAFVDNEQAQRIMGLVLRHMVGIQRTLGEAPTRFRPLLYMPDEKLRRNERAPAEATAWCEGYMGRRQAARRRLAAAVRRRRRARLDLPDRGARVRRPRRRLHRMGRHRREARRADRRAAGRHRAHLPLLARAARGQARPRHGRAPRRAGAGAGTAQVAAAAALTLRRAARIAPRPRTKHWPARSLSGAWGRPSPGCGRQRRVIRSRRSRRSAGRTSACARTRAGRSARARARRRS